MQMQECWHILPKPDAATSQIGSITRNYQRPCAPVSDDYLHRTDFLRFALKHACIHVYIVHDAQCAITLVR